MKEKGSNLEIERIDDVDKLEALREKWNALLEENETRTIELTYEWQLTYWKYFNENSKLFILIIKEGNDIIGIAPLKLTKIRRFGIRSRRLEFIAGEETNYQDFIIGNNKEKVLQGMFQYLVNNKNLWDVLSLIHIPDSSSTIGFLDNKIGNQFMCFLKDKVKCIFLKIDKKYEEYYKEIRKRRRKYVERFVRKMNREGEVDFNHCEAEDELIVNLKKMFDLHRKHWNQTDTPSQFNDKRMCAFYSEAVTKLLKKKEIGLSLLTFNKSTVSILLSFLYGREYILQITAYDTGYKSLAPSIVHWHFFIKDVFSKNTELIDFGVHYPYKELWGNRFKDKMSFEIYPKRIFRSYYFYLLENIYIWLRNNVRKIPAAVRFARYMRRKRRHRNDSNDIN